MPTRVRSSLLVLLLLPALLAPGCASGRVVPLDEARPRPVQGGGLAPANHGLGFALGQALGLALAPAGPYVFTGVMIVVLLPVDLLTLPVASRPFHCARSLLDWLRSLTRAD